VIDDIASHADIDEVHTQATRRDNGYVNDASSQGRGQEFMSLSVVMRKGYVAGISS
jgi:hypothetical protein